MNFTKFYESQELVDATLLCQGNVELKCHSLLLATRSDYFRVGFSKSTNRTMDCTDIPIDILQVFVRACYDPTLTFDDAFDDSKTFVEAILAADMLLFYQFRDLLILAFHSRCQSLDDVLDLLRLSLWIPLPPKVKKTVEKCASHLYRCVDAFDQKLLLASRRIVCPPFVRCIDGPRAWRLETERFNSELHLPTESVFSVAGDPAYQIEDFPQLFLPLNFCAFTQQGDTVFAFTRKGELSISLNLFTYERIAFVNKNQIDTGVHGLPNCIDGTGLVSSYVDMRRNKIYLFYSKKWTGRDPVLLVSLFGISSRAGICNDAIIWQIPYESRDPPMDEKWPDSGIFYENDDGKLRMAGKRGDRFEWDIIVDEPESSKDIEEFETARAVKEAGTKCFDLETLRPATVPPWKWLVRYRSWAFDPIRKRLAFLSASHLIEYDCVKNVVLTCRLATSAELRTGCLRYRLEFPPQSVAPSGFEGNDLSLAQCLLPE